MKRLLVALVIFLAACASGPNAQIQMAYDSINAYVLTTKTSLERGRITPDQAAKASANAKKAREAVDSASLAIGSCKPPCNPETILQNLQPTLLELERELRAREQK